jgi:N-acetyl-anhydromuramyl-L-alanine amidase AmpD
MRISEASLLRRDDDNLETDVPSIGSGVIQHTTDAMGGGLVVPSLIILHYTAGPSISSAINGMRDSGTSAHFVIGRGGQVHQLVPLNRVAYHAGVSEWDGVSMLNGQSIGIEIVNAGPLEEVDGRFETWYGRAVFPEDVRTLVHRNERMSRHWHDYPDRQVEVVEQLCHFLFREIPSLSEVIGHEQCSPGRKDDPGPAFPLDDIARRVADRRQGRADAAVSAINEDLDRVESGSRSDAAESVPGRWKRIRRALRGAMRRLSARKRSKSTP